MKQLFLLVVTVLESLILFAQNSDICISGNCQNGLGKLKYANGTILEANFVNGKAEGMGTQLWATGDKYIGQYKNGNKTGKGKYIYSGGSIYEGDFVENQITGNGIFKFSNGEIYEGAFINSEKNGIGILKVPNGFYIKGLFKNDVFAESRLQRTYTLRSFISNPESMLDICIFHGSKSTILRIVYFIVPS